MLRDGRGGVLQTLVGSQRELLEGGERKESKDAGTAT